MNEVEKGSGFDSLSIDDLKMELPPPLPDQLASLSPRRKGKQQFVMVPLHWAEKLAKATHLATYRVALHLLFQTWKKRGKTIPLSNMGLRDKGVSPREKSRALKELERFGLIKVARNPGEVALNRGFVGMKVVSPWDTEVHVTWDIKVPGLGKPGTQESQRVLFSSYMSYTLS